MVTKIGIIGFGAFGQFLYQCFKPMPDVKVVAVADSKRARDPGHTKFYVSWKNLITDNEIDIVWIATVPDVHAEIACDSMQAGRDVIIEKPIAITLKDARQILKIRDRTARLATVNYMMRFNPLCKLLADFTRENVFGQLRRVNIENYAQDETLPAKHWFWKKELSGGILIEHAVHFIDLVNYFSGQDFRTVTGLSHNRNPGQEDQVLASVLYEKGLIASHYHSFSRPGFFERTSIRLNYDLAEFDIEGWLPLEGNFRALVNKDSYAAINLLPGVEIKNETKISNLIRYTNHPLRSGGIKYDVTKMVEGTFKIHQGKQQVYADCVRSLLSDVIAHRQNSSHKLRVSLEDGISSLKIACMAVNHAA
ncbi:MAG: hypothetical protein A2Y10_19425 [Planctomycetes bacterium GWF2_41_51]|nr:MAG: hypothetical protein A2Y10_19425 [Planctomycetes bacterium GWF2_41_51]